VTRQEAVSAPQSPEELDDLIRQWQKFGVRVDAVAADLAQIRSGQPPAWQELPPVPDPAARYDVSHCTMGTAKQFLAEAGLLTTDGGRYVVGAPAATGTGDAGARG
jgi:hypothetical protein